MTHLIQLDESIEVQRPLHEVFAYISEFSRIEEWDPAVARDARKAKRVAQDLERRFGNKRIHVEIAELSLLEDVKALAARLLRNGKAIDVLANNAGALVNPREETAEGLEKSYALLLLGPYVLVEPLHPLLRKAASQHGAARVVNAMHPGWADTPGVVASLPEFHRVTKRVLRTPEEGADTIVWLAAATEAGRVSGEFWLDRRPHAKHVLTGTRETPAERRKLLKALASFV